LASCQAPYNILWDAVSYQWMYSQASTDCTFHWYSTGGQSFILILILSRSTDEPKGSKTPKVTRGNTQDKKLTRVHDCKRGKPTLLKLKINFRVLEAHSKAEDTNINSNLVYHHVDRDVKPLYGGGVLQANSSIHGGKNSLHRE